MNDLVVAQVENGGEGGPARPTILGLDPFFFMIIVMILIFYFLVLGPQRQREKQRREMLDSIRKGDQVVTSGGICGTILKVNESRVVVRVNDDPAGKIEFVREAIARVEPKDAGKKKDDGDDDDGHDEDDDDK